MVRRRFLFSLGSERKSHRSFTVGQVSNFSFSLRRDFPSTPRFFFAVGYVHLFDFTPLCVFKYFLEGSARKDAYVTFSLCVFKCLIKLPALEDAKSHWLRLFDCSLLCIFKCCLKSPASERKEIEMFSVYFFVNFFAVIFALNISAIFWVKKRDFFCTVQYFSPKNGQNFSKKFAIVNITVKFCNFFQRV